MPNFLQRGRHNEDEHPLGRDSLQGRCSLGVYPENDVLPLG